MAFVDVGNEVLDWNRFGNHVANIESEEIKRERVPFVDFELVPAGVQPEGGQVGRDHSHYKDTHIDIRGSHNDVRVFCLLGVGGQYDLDGQIVVLGGTVVPPSEHRKENNETEDNEAGEPVKLKGVHLRVIYRVDDLGVNHEDNGKYGAEDVDKDSADCGS